MPFWPKLVINYDETVRKNPTRPPVSWPVHVWEKGPGYGEDAKNLAIQCGWEEVWGKVNDMLLRPTTRQAIRVSEPKRADLG